MTNKEERKKNKQSKSSHKEQHKQTTWKRKYKIM